MSFLEALLDGRTDQERKQKQTCAIVISITAILLVVAIIAFAICQVIDATSNNNSDENGIAGEAAINLGEMTTETRSENMIFTGNLLTLNSSAQYNGRVDVIDIQHSANRPKTEAGSNAYTANFQGTYYATEETAAALNEMIKDFYEAKKDDNIFISDAYNTNAVDTQNAIYSSGEAVALSYFHDYEVQKTGDPRSIQGVDTYKWIYTNCYKYGFVPISSSSNIFRYVGNTQECKAHALAAKNASSLDKYLKELKNATPDNPLKLDSEGTMVAYTCPVNNIKVPKNYKWEITSGNNIDGVIVTVTLAKVANNATQK